jgi:hypothetical protein
MGGFESVVRELLYLFENYFMYSLERNRKEGVCLSKLYNTFEVLLSNLES